MTDTVEKAPSSAFAPVLVELEKARFDCTSGDELEAGWSAAIDRALEIVRAADLEYRDRLGTQITEGMATLQRAGLRYSGETPYGYKVGPDGRTLVEYHAEQRAIALALEQRAAGGTLRGIAAELERRGYLARTGKAFDSRQISRLVKGMKRG